MWKVGSVVAYSRSDGPVIAHVIEILTDSAARIEDDNGTTYAVYRHSPQLRAATLTECEEWQLRADRANRNRMRASVARTPLTSPPTGFAPTPGPVPPIRRCTTCSAVLPAEFGLAQVLCGVCASDPRMTPTKRRAALVRLRESAGAAIPEIKGGTPRDCAWALDIATEIITRMPPWLWLAVREEMTQNGLEDDLVRPLFWIHHRKMGFYGFLAVVLARCLAHRRPEQPVPVRLLAITLYVGMPSLARSGVLDELLRLQPLTTEDEKVLLVFLRKHNSFPLARCAAPATVGLAQMDPLATATGWIAAATPETPSSNQESLPESLPTSPDPAPIETHPPTPEQEMKRLPIPENLEWLLASTSAKKLEDCVDGSSLWRTTLTPRKAVRLLAEHNERNRTMTAAQTAAIRQAIIRGEWVTSSEIIFDRDGQVIDAQHRLQAIVAAGRNVTCRILINVCRADMLKQIPEVPRRARDVVALNYSDNDGTPIRLLPREEAVYAALRRTASSRRGRLSGGELKEAYDSPLWPFIAFAARLRERSYVGCMPMRIAALLAVHSGEHSEDEVRDAWDNWINGTIDPALIPLRDEVNRKNEPKWSRARGYHAATAEVQSHAQAVMQRLLCGRRGRLQKKLPEPVWAIPSVSDTSN